MSLAMIEFLKNILMLLTCWIILTLIIAWLHALCYPILRASIASVPAVHRSTIAFAYSVAPSVTAMLVLVLYSQPSLITSLVKSHCHDSQCSPHGLHLIAAMPWGKGIVLALIIAIIIVGLLIIRQLIVSKRYLQSLNVISSESSRRHYRIIKTDQPIAWCAGFWNTQVYISHAFKESLNEKQFKFILAHESAHAERRDNLRKLIVRWMIIPWPGTFKSQFHMDFSNDLEQICDLTAAAKFDDCDDIETVIETALSRCHQKESVENNDRIKIFSSEKYFSSKNSMLSNIKLVGHIGVLIFLWLMLLIMLIHFAHPILEWLLQ
jgi:beta-lactamase regulating signal transducer with metallopeptidase domain